MIFRFLQTVTPLEVDTEYIKHVNDSIQEAALQMIEQMKMDPKNFVNEMIHSFGVFALKLLSAIIIYLVGAWIIRRIKKRLKRVFEKRNADDALASFVSSLVSITLTPYVAKIDSIWLIRSHAWFGDMNSKRSPPTCG